MKRSELKRGSSSLRRKTPLKPSGTKALKRRVERDWRAARGKVEREGVCRACDPMRDLVVWPLDSAHVIGRDRDEPKNPEDTKLWVNPDSIIPLCRTHHREFDERKRDILHLLTLDEQLDAVKRAGGIELARIRLCPSQYREAA